MKLPKQKKPTLLPKRLLIQVWGVLQGVVVKLDFGKAYEPLMKKKTDFWKSLWPCQPEFSFGSAAVLAKKGLTGFDFAYQ